MAHHSDEHVREYDDNGDVVESEQEESDALNDRSGVTSAGEAVGILVTLFLRRVLDLDALYSNETKHRPEETEEGPRHPRTSPANKHWVNEGVSRVSG